MTIRWSSWDGERTSRPPLPDHLSRLLPRSASGRITLGPYPPRPKEYLSCGSPDEVRHQGIAVVHPLVDLVGGVGHVNEWHYREDDHHRDEQEAYDDHRQESRDRPPHGEDHRPGHLVERRLQGMEGYPLGAIPVDKPDDQGHHGTQEARDQVDEDGEVGKDRPGSLVPRADGRRRGHTRTRPAAGPSGLGLHTVVSTLLGQGTPPYLSISLYR